MGTRRPQHYYSDEFAAKNRPGTCSWCGRDIRNTLVDEDYHRPPHPALFCSLVCAADFGENVARMGYRFDARSGQLVLGTADEE
jgi:hypothetical protein